MITNIPHLMRTALCMTCEQLASLQRNTKCEFNRSTFEFRNALAASKTAATAEERALFLETYATQNKRAEQLLRLLFVIESELQRREDDAAITIDAHRFNTTPFPHTHA